MSVLKDILGYSASAVIAQVVGLMAGFYVARMLGPSDFGIWNAVSLVLVYGAYLDFGVLSAMGRDLPFHTGRGDLASALTLEGAARVATIAGAVIVAIVVAAGASRFSQSGMVATGFQFMAAALVLQQVYTYHRTVLRAENQFGELSRQQVILAVGTALLTVGCVAAIGLIGRMAAAVLAQAAILLYAVRRNPWRRVPRFNGAAMWSLMRVGIPITISGFVLSFVTTVDRVMVFSFLGNTQLGYFGLALLVTSIISLVPSMASQVLYPRITFAFGRSGRDVASLRPFVLTPPLVLACLVPLVIGPAYVLLPLLIRLFLPAYSPGLVATRIVLVGIFFYSILGLTDYFLVTIGKLKQYVAFGCLALALNVALDYLALRLGYGIEGIAVTGTALTYLVYSSIVIGYALSHYTRAIREWCVYFSRLWLPFVYMMGLLWVGDLLATRLVSPSTPGRLAVGACAQVAFYALGAVPLILAASRVLNLDLRGAWAQRSEMRMGR